MKILFMGTPDFALFTLRALYEAGEDVVGVVTQPDKPKGRGYALVPPPVKVFALEKNIPVFQPATLKNHAFDDTLSALSPDVIVVAAYGKILPEEVLCFPPYGALNVHGSLLPAYRGAAPMQRAILNGEKTTGITVMQMDAGLDTGDMLLSESIEIGKNDDFETVHDKLGALGAKLMLTALKKLREGALVPVKQDASKATYAAKIEKEDCQIVFAESAAKVHDRVRALSPVPLAFTHTPDGKLLKVVKSRVSTVPVPKDAAPGCVIALSDAVTVACGKGAIDLLRVLPEGKGKMDAADYIRGRRLFVGDMLS